MSGQGMIIGSLVGLVVWLVIGSLFGAVALRAAVALVNKILGPQESSEAGSESSSPRPDRSDENVVAYSNSDPSNPFRAPTALNPLPERHSGLAIPTPDFLRAVMVMFAVVFAAGGCSIAVGILTRVLSIENMLGMGTALGVIVPLSLILNVLVGSTIVRSLLPTTYGKALSVYLLTLLMLFAVALVFVLLISTVG